MISLKKVLLKICESIAYNFNKIVSVENSVIELDKNSIKAVYGRVGFPAAAVGAQTLRVNFPKTLPSTPFYVGLVWDDSGNAIISKDTYMGEICLVVDSTSTTGFTAQAHRYNANYSWYFKWVALYYDN